MRRDLDEARCFRKIDGSVSDFGEEDRVDLRVMLEVLEHTHALNLRSATMNVQFAKFPRVVLVRRQGKVDFVCRI